MSTNDANPYSTNALTGYQVDNLISNRIPFVLINLNVKLEQVFSSMALIHARNQTLVDSQNPEKVLTKMPEILAELQQRKLAKESPLIFICETGHDSQNLCLEFEKLGYKNAFFALNGVEGIKSTRD